jgi:hypothetical protein
MLLQPPLGRFVTGADAFHLDVIFRLVPDTTPRQRQVEDFPYRSNPYSASVLRFLAGLYRVAVRLDLPTSAMIETDFGGENMKS